jgi:hypothetical protein
LHDHDLGWEGSGLYVFFSGIIEHIKIPSHSGIASKKILSMSIIVS